jgi:hypothetical protein
MREKLHGTIFTKKDGKEAYIKQSRFKGANLGAAGKGRKAVEKVIRRLHFKAECCKLGTCAHL